jgi:hypothetical protein
MVLVMAYFRLAAAVRSNLPVTTNVALHQLEPSPAGLIGVKSPVNRAVWSLVNALQSPLFRLLSLCVPKIRFWNIGNEDRRGQAVM